MYDIDCERTRVTPWQLPIHQSTSESWEGWTYPPPPHDDKFCECWEATMRGPLVYFVRDQDGRLKYIGKTKQLLRKRLAVHQVADYDADTVAWYCFSESDYGAAELYYIGTFRPYANGEV